MKKLGKRKVYLLFTLIMSVFIAVLSGCGGGGGGEWKAPPVPGTVTVTSTDPANAATGIFQDSKISAAFSGAVDPASLTSETFHLKQGTTAILGTVSYSGVTAVFTPAAPFEANVVYTATITSGVKDLNGNALASDYSWFFTTGTTTDITAPTVTSTSAPNGATGLPTDRSSTALFSEPMDPSTINNSSYTVTGPGTTPVAGTVTYVGVTATFKPANTFAPNTTYTSTITVAARDLAGKPLASDYVWRWTTGNAPDTTLPTVSSTIPANLATGVAINGNSSANFSEAMNPLTITNNTFTLKNGATPVAGTVSYVGTTATFNPTVNLINSTAYTATITGGINGVKDLAGNALVSNHVWSFTTGNAPDTTLPTVNSTIPANLAIGVAINGNSSANFSEAMNPLTITNNTFTLKNGATPVAGTVSYVGTIATFNPTVNLINNTTYTATITGGINGVKDLAGNALASNHVWSFTTGIAPDTKLPTVVSTLPAKLATGVALNTNINAVFDEAMNPLTINNITFTLKNGATPVAGTVSYVGTTATFNPTANLSSSTTYTAKITGGVNGVKDLAGNALASDYLCTFTTIAVFPAGQLAVPLGSSTRFAILSNSAITNIPSSSITGDVGISPGARSSIAGLTNPEVIGTIYAANDADPVPAMLIAAKTDAQIAFLNANAAVRGTPTPISGNINGLTLVAGLYESGSSIEISPGGFLYLDAGGNVNAVFIIRSATSITTSPTSKVILMGGAKASNIYWTAGSAITLGVNSEMKGTLLAGTSISLLTGARLDGRALIQGAAAGQISLDQSTIVRP